MMMTIKMGQKILTVAVSCTGMLRHSASGCCILMLHLDVSGLLSAFIFTHCMVGNVTILQYTVYYYYYYYYYYYVAY